MHATTKHPLTKDDLAAAYARACKDRDAAVKAGHKKQAETSAIFAAFFRPVRVAKVPS